MSALATFVGPAIGGADGEDYTLRAIIALPAKPGGKCLRGELFSAAVKQNEGGRSSRLVLESVEESALGSKCRRVRRCKRIHPLQIPERELFRLFPGLVAGADVGKDEVHKSEDINGSP